MNKNVMKKALSGLRGAVGSSLKNRLAPPIESDAKTLTIEIHMGGKPAPAEKPTDEEEDDSAAGRMPAKLDSAKLRSKLSAIAAKAKK